MASIRKRNGTYQIIVSLGRDSTGHKITETTTYTPKATTPRAIEKEVEEFSRVFEDRVKSGKYFDGEKITFEEYADTWRADWAKFNLTKRVQEDYDSILKNRVFPYIGNLKIAKIRPSNIQAIITKMSSKYAVKTIKYTYTVINSVMSYAYNMEVIGENPCSRCKLPKQSEEIDGDKLHFFDLDQAKTFLNALSREYKSTYKSHERTLKKTGEAYTVPEYEETRTIPLQFQAYFQIAIYGGFRRGEMIAITWDDVDFQKNTISINKAFTRTKEEGQFLKPPKTKAGNRTVVLPASCFETLKKWKTEQMELCLKLGTQWKGSRGKDYGKNFVFIQTESGRAMDLDTPSHKFGEILAMYNATCEREEDKLPIIRLHDLRHTSATLLLSEGVDIETVSKRLGHEKASVTLDIYGHALPAKDDEASRKLETLFA